jgi:hypothetical protein
MTRRPVYSTPFCTRQIVARSMGREETHRDMKIFQARAKRLHDARRKPVAEPSVRRRISDERYNRSKAECRRHSPGVLRLRLAVP